jgi:hypothetical protein
MKKLITIQIFILLYYSSLFSQSDSDKVVIYNSVLQSIWEEYKGYLDEKLLILDSTVTVPFVRYNKIPDSIYYKYFNLSSSTSEKIDKIFTDFKESSKKKELIPKDILQNERLKSFGEDSVGNFFDSCEKSSHDLDYCWDLFYKTYGFIGYCGLSKVYFVNEKTAILYYYDGSGSLSGTAWLYILHKEERNWKVAYRIIQWES